MASEKKKPKKTMLIEIEPLESWYGSVNYWGHNEGGGSPLNNEKEIQDMVKRLIKQYKDKYKIKVEDKRIKQATL